MNHDSYHIHWGCHGCLFVTERHTFSDLIDGLSTACTCGMLRSPWEVQSYSTYIFIPIYILKCGCFCRKVMCCEWCLPAVDANASETGPVLVCSCIEPGVCLYLLCPFPVGCFTCTGMLPVQYSKFTQFAGLGVLGMSYISRSMRRNIC